MRTALLALLALAVVAAGVVAKDPAIVLQRLPARCLEAVPDATAGSTSSRAPTAGSRRPGGSTCPSARRPHSGGHCVRPDVFDIDLYVDGQVSGNNHTIDTAGRRTRSTAAGPTRSATCRRAPPSASVPTIRRYVAFDRSHHHSLMGKPFSRQVPERVLAQPQERPRTAGLRPRQSRGPHEEVRPGRLRRGRVRRRGRLRAGPQGDRMAHHRPPAARLRPGAGLDRASKRPLGGAQERHRPGPEARAAIRLRDQRAVLPVPGVHEQPRARATRRSPRAGKAVFQVEYQIRPGRFCGHAGRLRDQLDQEGLGLLARREALEALPLALRVAGSACRGS